jgi:GNAT superfamily N-acetyltransferase
MATEILELKPDEPDPRVECDRGVALIAATDRRLHGPDCHLVVLDGGSLVARCSCWWHGTAPIDGGRLGVVGHYAASDAASAARLLSRACSLLADAGCTTAAGPMDGNTWRRYRFIVERGPEPPFFLEPDNPDDWPAHWTASGFSPLAHYTSAMNDDLHIEDPRTADALPRLRSHGIRIRPFDPSRADDELHRMFRLSTAAFSGNFLYSPLSEEEFMLQNRAVLPFVRPELVLLAEKDAEPAGFMFALPDALQARRGEAIDRVILKTVAVEPAFTGMGLGGALMDLVQRAARQLGFRRAIHALVHERNVSRRISDRYAHTIRRYALFARALDRP